MDNRSPRLPRDNTTTQPANSPKTILQHLSTWAFNHSLQEIQLHRAKGALSTHCTSRVVHRGAILIFTRYPSSAPDGRSDDRSCGKWAVTWYGDFQAWVWWIFSVMSWQRPGKMRLIYTVSLHCIYYGLQAQLYSMNGDGYTHYRLFVRFRKSRPCQANLVLSWAPMTSSPRAAIWTLR